ncbi:MAG TPA: Sec-independent protein translocase protein TatB [Steroidobacteraceae bacterium]|nr:Sec-independent protein translocase protein TatB [Steroidobacteraceae bacterium]
MLVFFRMFAIDFPEILVIFGVALVVLGPKKLPAAAAQVGRWVGRARAMARQFREQLEQEVASVENALDSNPTRATPGKGTRVPPPGQAEAAAPPAATPSSGPESAVEGAAAGEGWYPPFGGASGFGMEPAAPETAEADGASATPQPYTYPASQPHPEASMVVHPAPPAAPALPDAAIHPEHAAVAHRPGLDALADSANALQGELPFGEAPSSPGGAQHGRSD